MTPPPKFPHVVCWNAASRLDVMNTVALSVRPSVFQATHFPSLIQRLNTAVTSARGAPYSEEELLADFLKPGYERLFCVAVGDSGSGKSHLIRWLWQQVETKGNPQWHIVRIPRHAANLADVLSHIMKDFAGGEVEHIRREIQRTVDLTEHGAGVRVLDTLAFVLGRENREKTGLKFPDEEMHQEVILPFLPPMLHDAVIRRHFFGAGEKGIVARLARHVMGTRGERSEAPTLRWTAQDLNISAVAAKGAGADAAQLASTLYSDETTRADTAAVLNQALEEAWPLLVGLQRGNLSKAMLEIRRQLRLAGRELLLFLEDLSVTQGMDAELIESLIVKPSEANDEVCALRSIIGLTNEDFRSLTSNIRGRLDLAVSFDVSLDADPARLSDFASRYLDAARYALDDLDDWHSNNPGGAPLPSFCEESQCPNRSDCHKTFGAVNGRGLYPFNGVALSRLYSQLQGDERTAFNPRVLVGQVLSEFLKRAEGQLETHTFPGSDLREWYKLGQATAKVEARLKLERGSLAPRLLTAIELYTESPWAGKLPAAVAEKFGLPGEGAMLAAGMTTAGTSAPPVAPTLPVTTATPVAVVVTSDEFDLWLRDKQVAEKDINRWRQAVYYAMSGARDWDSDPLGPLFFERFKRTFIHFQGQLTTQSGDVKIVIQPTAEAAMALRGLVGGFQNRDEALYAAACVEEWTAEIVAQLGKLWRVPGQPKPLAAAVHLLALGALVRGKVPENASRAEFLHAMFEEWPALPASSGPGASAWTRLREGFQRSGQKLRDWILRQIGGTKGGQVGTAMIDLGQILEDVESARRRVRVEFPDDFGRDWDGMTFRPVLDLAAVVRTHLENAIKEEAVDCDRWIDALAAVCGGYSTRDLGAGLKAAFAAALSANALNHPRVNEYTMRCENFVTGEVEKLAQTARGVTADKARNHQLRLLAQLDRRAMQDAEETWRFAQTQLTYAHDFLSQKLADSDVINQTETERKVCHALAALRTQVQGMLGDRDDGHE